VRELPSTAKAYGARYAHARKELLATLAALEPGVWLEPGDVLDRIQDRDPDFLFAEHSRVETTRGSYYGGYAHTYYAARAKTLLKQFEQFETQFVHKCLTGFLHEIGVLELGYSGKVVCFRIVAGGVAAPGARPAERAARLPDEKARHDAGRLVVQPSFQLMAIGPVSLALLAQLDLFAEREQVDRGAFAYRLTKESVYRAQKLGMGVADVRSILEQHSDTDVPQNVRRSLDEWAAHHERIVFRTGVSLLQAADADLMAELSGSPHTSRYIARAITPEIALLKKSRQRQLISALVGQGLLPAVSDDRPEAADRSIVAHDDGTVHPVHSVPCLHLRGRLSRLAEETAEGAWRLTPASIRRAGGSREKVLGLLEELGKLHRGELPPRLVERIKAWGGYYGGAAAETLTLIEFHDSVTLDELMARPELAPYLSPFPAEGRALAIVPAGKLKELEGLLSRLGVEVQSGLCPHSAAR
jgi:hypothetical protein